MAHVVLCTACLTRFANLLARSLELALLVIAPLLAISREASAQFGATAPTVMLDRKNHEAGRDPTDINYDDCIDDDDIEVDVTFPTAAQDYQFEVWAGLTSANCADDGERKENPGNLCWLIASSEPLTGPYQLRVQDILPHGASNPGTGTEAACNQTSSGSVTVYFLLVGGGVNQLANPPTLSFKHDLAGPRAPRLTKINSGEESLILTWEASRAVDVTGYRLYCELGFANEELNGTQQGFGGTNSSFGGASTAFGGASTAFGGTSSGLEGGTGQGGPTGVGGTDDGSGTTGGQDTGGGGTTSTGSESGGSPGTAGGAAVEPDECQAETLRSGERPPENLRRGSVGQGITEGTAKGLEDYQLYACGVAAYDLNGNLGVLSNIRCGSPRPVRDYFEAYREAGGKGGGGYCGFGRGQVGGLAALLGFAGLVFAARRARRRSSV